MTIDDKIRERRALNAIRDRLNIPTVDLSDEGLVAVWRLAGDLVMRLSIEEYGRRKGWDQHTYAFGSPGWEELHDAWLDDTDDDGTNEPVRTHGEVFTKLTPAGPPELDQQQACDQAGIVTMRTSEG